MFIVLIDVLIYIHAYHSLKDYVLLLYIDLLICDLVTTVHASAAARGRAGVHIPNQVC